MLLAHTNIFDTTGEMIHMFKRSPGEVKGQHDLQRCPLEAVFGAQTEAGCLSIGLDGDYFQVSSVQGL